MEATPDSNSSKPQRLSEISHLFLSDIRAAASDGRRAPVRRGPGQHEPTPADAGQAGHSVDQSVDDDTLDLSPGLFNGEPLEDGDLRPIDVVVGARLGGDFTQRVVEYAAGLAGDHCGGVGIIVLDPSELRLLQVEASPAGRIAGACTQSVGEITTDLKRLRRVLEQADCEVDRWLIALPDPSIPASKQLLGACRSWTLLARADHDGTVAGYRTLKGLCEQIDATDDQSPQVTLAMLDAESDQQAERQAEKLIGVCRRFLSIDIDELGNKPADTLRPGDHASSWQTNNLLTVVLQTGSEPTLAIEIVLDALSSDTGDDDVIESNWNTDGLDLDEMVYRLKPESTQTEDDIEPIAQERDATEPVDSLARKPKREPEPESVSKEAGVDETFNPSPAHLDGEDALEAALEQLEPIELPAPVEPAAEAAIDPEPAIPLKPDFPEPSAQPTMNQPQAPSLHLTDSFDRRFSRPEPESNDAFAEFTSGSFVSHSTSPRPSISEPMASSQPIPQIDASQIPNLAKPIEASSPQPSTVQPMHTPIMKSISSPAPQMRLAASDDVDEVIEIGPGDQGIAGVLRAILNRPNSWAITAIDIPGLSDAKIVVTSAGQIQMIAAASKGLSEISQIGRALSWARTNRQLLGMALSQWRIDGQADITLHLLVHHSDAEADALRPLMGESGVSMQTYRRLSWAGRQGLLLEAA